VRTPIIDPDAEADTDIGTAFAPKAERVGGATADAPC